MFGDPFAFRFVDAGHPGHGARDERGHLVGVARGTSEVVAGRRPDRLGDQLQELQSRRLGGRVLVVRGWVGRLAGRSVLLGGGARRGVAQRRVTKGPCSCPPFEGRAWGDRAGRRTAPPLDLKRGRAQRHLASARPPPMGRSFRRASRAWLTRHETGARGSVPRAGTGWRRKPPIASYRGCPSPGLTLCSPYQTHGASQRAPSC